MKNLIPTLSLCSIALLACGCSSNKTTDTAPKASANATPAAHADESQCKEVKAGTVTTVNKFCAVVHEDPVDPKLMVEYKGQKVGFCCPHCVGTWKQMTDAQRDASLAKALAKN